MCKYYLVSNSIHLNEELFNTLNIDDNHTIILFNHSYPLKFINNKNKILFIRETDKVLTGIDNDFTNYKKVYFFITSDKSYFSDKFEKLDLLKINYEIINIYDFIKEYHPEYPENNLPTCGFLGYLYLTKNKKYNIHNDINNFYLVGFTGHHSNGHDYNGIEHNYLYEQIYYKENNVTILLKK